MVGHVYVKYDVKSFGYITTSVIAEFYCRYIFNFLRIPHTDRLEILLNGSTHFMILKVYGYSLLYPYSGLQTSVTSGVITPSSGH